MKIAVTHENGHVFGHFGHTKNFKIYEINDGKVTSCAVIPTLGSGHSALAGFLLASGVTILICGGIGAGAQTALKEAGIAIYGGVSGDCDAAVRAFLANKLDHDPDVKCNHHGEEHSCGEHSCGTHNCR